ncbi:MAG: ABC transporter permease [Bacilli bacterium]|nr:ABC transporter permease [Bacilli bacterium]
MNKNQFPELPKEKFQLVNENRPLHDKELVTKPRSFFADAMYRFSRNKGSIVGAIVIGILVLYAIIAPMLTPYTVSYNDGYFRYTLPKVFVSENIDFLDGCTKKTLNETSFLYDYAIGAESGENAVKRQEYTRAENAQGQMMYTYRQDSYRKAGQVFLTGVTQAEFESIQAYQDANNVQIVYPITDPDLRPAATQNTNNANYWYKTEMSGSNTAITGYTENADGTFSFENIYSAYVTPTLRSSQTFSLAQAVNLYDADGGYKLAFEKEVDVTEDGATEKTYIHQTDYFRIILEDDNEVAVCDTDAEAATVFAYDSTRNTLVATVTGHEDASLDGDYAFAIPADRDSAVQIVPVSEVDAGTALPFGLYESEGVQATSVSAGEDYYFGASRGKTTAASYFASVDSLNVNNVATAGSSATRLTFTANSTSGFALKLGTDKPNLAKYLKLSASGNDTVFERVSGVDNGSVWNFDSARNTIYTTVTGHTDSSLDGNYYIAFNSDYTATEAVLESNIASDTNLALLYVNNTTLATEVSAGIVYLSKQTSSTTYKYYYATGGFNGDNYTSKMRVEGEDNFLYAYARQTGNTYEIRVNYFRYYSYYHQAVLKDGITGPYFLFGTTHAGQDIFVCLASGARFSFIMAIVVAVVNMVVGAIYGAIEGYYGGKIDLVMERIVEILSAVPFMIVITLLKYHMGGSSQVLILFIAFFLTGWIGESGTVRMQFYRFKNQEYVLAARTLGAKDPRIMFRHIFPNALGTIVTGSVLVIPGMIFSETSLSYLGIINLNSGTMTSVGTLLANGQPYLVTYPHIILFPAIFISLLMLCFNLFGNGLRDAFNPSLRGTED